MEAPSIAQRKIVIVEDNPGDVLLVREALQAHGIACELEAYDNGEEAVQCLSQNVTCDASTVPVLVLLDWNLPTIGGADVLKAIRKQPNFRLLPVAILTSSGSPKDRAEALRLGATRFIQKPIGLVEFIDEVGQNVREMLG